MIKILSIGIILILSFNVSCGFAGSTSVENRNAEILAQKSIDVKGIESFFHVEKLPERSPLIVVKNKYTNGIKLSKFHKDVVFWDKKKINIKNAPYLEFVKIEVMNNKAFVHILYPPEGVYAELVFHKSNQSWNLEKSKIQER